MAGELRLGLNIGYWAGGPPPGAPDAIAEAERLGYDSLWTAEAYGSDALIPLAWWGAKTERLMLGSAIVQISARTPAARNDATTSAAYPSASDTIVATTACTGASHSGKRPA